MPATDLRQLQLGQEGEFGTAVTPTAKLMGYIDSTFSFADIYEQVERKGSLAPSELIARTARVVTGSLEMACTFEDILYPLLMLFGTVSPSGTGPYIWTFTAPTTTAVDPVYMTGIFGTSDGDFKATSMFARAMTLAGERRGLWRISSLDLLANTMGQDDLGELDDRDVNLIRAGDTQFFMDAWDDIIGGTPVTQTLISAELSIDTGRHVKHFMHSIAPSATGQTGWTGTLKTRLEWNATVNTLISSLSAVTSAPVQRKIRLKEDTGTNWFRIDFYGSLIEATDLFEDEDGNVCVDLTWVGTYNTTAGKWLQIIVTNDVSAIT